MKKFLLMLAVGLLAACATPPSGTPELSPREQADPILTGYAAVLVAVDQAVTSPLLADKADVKHKIQATSHAATDAVLAYGDLAKNCFRDAKTGVVGDASGRKCDMSGYNVAKTEAMALISQTSALTTAWGFKPAQATPGE